MQLKRRKLTFLSDNAALPPERNELMAFDIPSTVVPADQILRNRARFADAPVWFEVELAASSALPALQQASAVLAAADARLEAFRCSSNGRVLCRLRDHGAFDPYRMISALAATPALRLERWTIVVSATAGA